MDFVEILVDVFYQAYRDEVIPDKDNLSPDDWHCDTCQEYRTSQCNFCPECGKSKTIISSS